jgi:hypothetical protein
MQTMKKYIMVFKYKLEYEIEIDDDNINKKYPNYRWNFNSPKELADSLVPTIIYEADTDMSKNGLDKWGYSIKIKKVEVK